MGDGCWAMGDGRWVMAPSGGRGSQGSSHPSPLLQRDRTVPVGAGCCPARGSLTVRWGRSVSPWRGAEVGSVPPAPHRCGEVQRLFAKEGGAAATKGGAAFGFGAEGCSAAGEECADRRQQEPATPPLLPRVENHGNDYTEAWQYNHVQRIRMEKQNRPLRCGFVPTVGRTPSGPREPTQQRRPQWLHREQPPLPPTPAPRPPPPQ